MGLAVLLCTTRPARAAWQCGAAGSGITAEILAQDGADFVASRADCQCRFPLVMRIASSGKEVLPGAQALGVQCVDQSGNMNCGDATLGAGGAAVLVPLKGMIDCDSAPTFDLRLVDKMNALSTVECPGIKLADAFARPSFPQRADLQLKIESGQLTLRLPVPVPDMRGDPQDLGGVPAAIKAEKYQLLCRQLQASGMEPPAAAELPDASKYEAAFSRCRERTLILRRSGASAPAVTAAPTDMSSGVADLGDGGSPNDLSGAQDMRTDQGLQDMADLVSAPDQTQRDAFGPAAKVEWSASEADPAFLCSNAVSNLPARQLIPVTGLQSDRRYEVLLLAIDARGNAAPVGSIEGTPEGLSKLPDFGCGCTVGRPAAAPPAGSAALLLLMLSLGWRLRRGRRPARGGAVVLALLLWLGIGGSAQASPIGLQVNLKLGAYSPQLDTTPVLSGASLSNRVLSSGQLPDSGVGRRLMTQLEVDYLPLRGRFGQVGIGVVGGYSSLSGRSFATFRDQKGDQRTCTTDPKGASADGRVFVDNESTCLSNRETTVQVIPVQGLLVYRLDTLDRKFGVPLIPYLKGGVALHNFRVSDASGEEWGATLGMVLLAGLALNLGALEPRAQLALRRDFGIDRVTLFLEYSGSWINGLGGSSSATRLDLSEQGFNGGLGIEL